MKSFSLTSISPVEAQSPTDPWLIQFCLIKLLSFSCSVITTYWMEHKECYLKGDRLDPIHFEHYPILQQAHIFFTAQPRSRYRSGHFTVNLCPDIRTIVASAQTTCRSLAFVTVEYYNKILLFPIVTAGH